MAGRIGVDNVGAARFLHRAGEDDCTKFDGPATGCNEVRNRQVEMKLLRRTVWPFGRGIWRCSLEGQLERRVIGVHLTPPRITGIQLPVQQRCIKRGKSWRVGAVEATECRLIGVEVILVIYPTVVQ